MFAGAGVGVVFGVLSLVLHQAEREAEHGPPREPSPPTTFMKIVRCLLLVAIFVLIISTAVQDGLRETAESVLWGIAILAAILGCLKLLGLVVDPFLNAQEEQRDPTPAQERWYLLTRRIIRGLAVCGGIAAVVAFGVEASLGYTC